MSIDLEGIKRRFGIIGTHPQLDRAIEVAYQVAPTDLSVLVTGESGSGKEFFPQIIHQYSVRKHGQYIAVNCGAIPEGTIDSELFGHIKGAFTGALDNRRGYFEVADRGTIFLDEVAELPLSTQARLLRVLETGEFLRVGSSEVQKSDIRIIAATNENLQKSIAEGKFRADLYYRLATVPISIPPLRERGNDILMLFRFFANEFAEKYKMPPIRLDEEGERLLLEAPWPGNVRQLKNVTEQISIIERERTISARVLEGYLPVASSGRALPALYDRREADRGGRSERDLLFGVLYDMRREINELRQVVARLSENQPVYAAAHADDYQDGRGDYPRSLAMPERPYIPRIQDELVPRVIEGAPSRGKNEAQEELEISEIDHQNDPEDQPRVLNVTQSLASIEEETIREVLKKHHGHRKKASQELGISERTLYRKIKEYDLPRKY